MAKIPVNREIVPIKVLAEQLEDLLRDKHPGLIELLLVCRLELRETFIQRAIPEGSCENWYRARIALRHVLGVNHPDLEN